MFLFLWEIQRDVKVQPDFKLWCQELSENLHFIKTYISSPDCLFWKVKNQNEKDIKNLFR